jgi:hypothetical protein
MAADEVILRQNDGDALRLDHRGEVDLKHGGAIELGHHGKVEHKVGAELVHATPADRPLVHMVLWDENANVELGGRVTLTGDEKQPLHVRMHHTFDNEHQQSHRFDTALERPVHHALQMRTPLQVRFCNTWQIASDYSIEIRLGDNRVIGVRLTGATVAKPLPCEDEPCPPVVLTHPTHP